MKRPSRAKPPTGIVGHPWSGRRSGRGERLSPIVLELLLCLVPQLLLRSYGDYSVAREIRIGYAEYLEYGAVSSEERADLRGETEERLQNLFVVCRLPVWY